MRQFSSLTRARKVNQSLPSLKRDFFSKKISSLLYRNVILLHVISAATNYRTFFSIKMVGAAGFEPTITGSKPDALPLGYAPI